MQEFFLSGYAADVVLFFIAVEAVLLTARHRKTRRGMNTKAVLLSLTPGACLVIALRIALTGGWWGWIGLALIVSLAAHLMDMRERLKSS
jgi:hypothetical protein